MEFFIRTSRHMLAHLKVVGRNISERTLLISTRRQSMRVGITSVRSVGEGLETRET